MNERGWETAHLSEIPRTAPKRTAVRQHFGIEAFGMNIYSAGAGERVVDDHNEKVELHQELYFVLSGHATFTLDEEEVDAPPGTFVFVRAPETRRTAFAREDGTSILVAGARPGEAFRPSAWEDGSEAFELYESGDYERAAEVMREVFERHPGNGNALYNLACYESLVGQREEALEHLRQAADLWEDAAAHARGDPDFDPIREDPRFLAITGQPDAAGTGA